MMIHLRPIAFALVYSALGACLVPASRQPACQAQPLKDARDIAQLLKQPIEIKPLTEKVKLRTALEHFSEAFGGKLVILVDEEAFKEDLGADAPSLYDQDVSLPPINVKMVTNTALRLLLAQVGNGKATYTIRDGWIEITTTAAASSANMLSKKVGFLALEKIPLKDVCQELSAASGLTINVDIRIGEKSATPISATFQNSTVEEALIVVTESANLKFVVYPSSIFVTSPEHAKVLEKEEKERAKTRKPPERKVEAGA